MSLHSQPWNLVPLLYNLPLWTNFLYHKLGQCSCKHACHFIFKWHSLYFPLHVNFQSYIKKTFIQLKNANITAPFTPSMILQITQTSIPMAHFDQVNLPVFIPKIIKNISSKLHSIWKRQKNTWVIASLMIKLKKKKYN